MLKNNFVYIAFFSLCFVLFSMNVQAKNQQFANQFKRQPKTGITVKKLNNNNKTNNHKNYAQNLFNKGINKQLKNNKKIIHVATNSQFGYFLNQQLNKSHEQRANNQHRKVLWTLQSVNKNKSPNRYRKSYERSIENIPYNGIIKFGQQHRKWGIKNIKRSHLMKGHTNQGTNIDKRAFVGQQFKHDSFFK